ncbi:MAG: hypothetical protein JST86_15190 [Bacteroidetes bacterium]|nr:hypothetical protein [Bacteroidota bacterium]
MKIYCFLTMLLLAGFAAKSQNLDDIKKLVYLNQNAKAKDAIEKFLGETKNQSKADVYYYKGRVLNNLSRDSGVSTADAMKLKNESLEAFKKYQSLDAKEPLLSGDKYAHFFDLYNGYFDIGAKEFSAKDYKASFDAFKAALDVEDYVRSKNYDYNGFKFPPLDTSLVMNTAIVANNAKDEASAALYYSKLTDANLKAPQYLSVYQFLADYYLRTKDEAKMSAILDKGRTLYPEEDWWNDFELDRVEKTGDKAALKAKYEEFMKRFPDKYVYPYNYAVMLYNELYTADEKPANAEAVKAKLSEVLKTAINLDKGVDAKMLMVRHLYNYAFDYQDSSKKVKGVKPEDIKKKNQFKDMFLKKIDECIPYADGAVDYFAALPTLKTIQKANYKDVLDILSQFYNAKGDTKKAAEYDKKRDDLGKL